MKTLNPTGLGICAALLVASALLTGCGGRTDEQAKEMLTNPDINFVGVYEGCEVKYVDRGYQAKSFYIAKCGNTTTATRNYNEQSGKSTIFRQSTVITQEIEKLQAEKSAAETKERALEKLTPTERAALGIK
jgi:major membrane immunogen (membrane-anchored lipoprotein)